MGEIGDWYWHIHHDKLIEQLTEKYETRVKHIINDKPINEIKTRLKWMTPAELTFDEKFTLSTFLKEQEKDKNAILVSPHLEKLHREQHPGCPWNGKTILGEKV
jgi:hypothetical protein